MAERLDDHPPVRSHPYKCCVCGVPWETTTSRDCGHVGPLACCDADGFARRCFTCGGTKGYCTAYGDNAGWHECGSCGGTGMRMVWP